MDATEKHDYIQLRYSQFLEGVRRPTPYAVRHTVGKGFKSHEVIKRLPNYESLPEWFKSIHIPGVKKMVSPAYRVTWEFPIPGKSEPVGYVDLLVEHLNFEVQVIHDENIPIEECEAERDLVDFAWELKGGEPLNDIPNPPEMPVCLNPDHFRVVGNQYRHCLVQAVEIKSHIKSIGETIRQIRKYQAALPWCKCPYQYGQKCHGTGCYDYEPDFMVISPDDRFRDTLEGQGIKFVGNEYPLPDEERAEMYARISLDEEGRA